MLKVSVFFFQIICVMHKCIYLFVPPQQWQAASQWFHIWLAQLAVLTGEMAIVEWQHSLCSAWGLWTNAIEIELWAAKEMARGKIKSCMKGITYFLAGLKVGPWSSILTLSWRQEVLLCYPGIGRNTLKSLNCARNRLRSCTCSFSKKEKKKK